MDRGEAPTVDAHQLKMAFSTADDAIRAVALQCQRLGSQIPEDRALFTDEAFRRIIDFRFLALALRWLTGACELMARLTSDPDLLDALQRFDRALPEARGMRNLGEHLPDYIAGAGRMQRASDPSKRRGEPSRVGVMTWTGSPGAGLRMTWAGTDINVDEARRAAESLHAAARDALFRWRASSADQPA